jgi:hypothetical protein
MTLNDFEREGIHVFVERAKRLQRLTRSETPFYDLLEADHEESRRPWKWEDTAEWEQP